MNYFENQTILLWNDGLAEIYSEYPVTVICNNFGVAIVSEFVQ